MEDSQIFDQKIEAVCQHIRKLMEQSSGSPEQERALGEALKALSASLEELHVADEELRRQNEELLAARQMLEAERRQAESQREAALAEQERLLAELNAANVGLQTRNEELQTQAEELEVQAEELRCQADELNFQALKLEQEQARLRAIIDSAPEAILVADKRGQVVLANPAAEHLFAVPALGAAGLEHYAKATRYHPDHTPVARRNLALFRAAVHGEARRDEPQALLWPDGQWRDVLASAAPIVDEHGQSHGAVAVYQDITERLQAESQREAALAERERLLAQARQDREAIAALAQTLERERDTLQTIMESTHTHLAYLDPDFNFTRVNSAYVQGSGHSREELIGRNHFDLFPDAENRAFFEQVRDSGQQVVFHAKPFEFADQPERGVTYWDWTLVPVKKGEDGQVRGLVLSLMDVTPQVWAEQERERHMARLDTLIRASQEILAERTAGALLQQIVDAARELTAARIGVSGHGYRDGVFEVGAASRAGDMASCPPGAVSTIRQGGIYLELIERTASIRLTDEQLRARPAWRGLPEGHAPLRGLLGARLVGSDGRANGLIMVSDKEQGDFNAEDEALLTQLAAVASLALQHIQARDEAERRADELNAVFTAINEAVIVFDSSGRVARANPAANASYGPGLAGADRATVTQKLFLRHPDGRPVLAHELAAARALRGEQVRGKRFILTSADGRDMDILTSAAPLLADGRLVGSVVVWHDITERERLLADLAAERARLKAIIDNAPEAIVVTDLASHIVLANPAAEQLYGQPLPYGEDFNGQAALALCHPDSTPCAPRDLPLTRSALDGETLTSLDMAIAWPDGRRRDLLVSSAPIRDEAGRASGAVGIFQDVTERRQEQSQKEAALEALRESEERFRQIAENIEEVFWLVEPNASKIIYASPGYERVWGRSPQEIMDAPDAFFASIHPDDRELVRQTIQRYSAGESTDAEYRFFHSDGSLHWLWDRAFPLRRPDGTVYRIAGVAADITQRKQAEEKLKAALAENEVLMREIYHRVKNNIQTLISLMAMQAELITDEDSRAMIHELQVRARTMSLVHEQLYQSGNLAQIDFGAYLNDLTANLLRAFWADRPIVWDIDAADVLLGVDIAIPCGLIVNELLTNALKYAFPNARPVAERGETECKIRVEFRAEGNRFTLAVADNGVGLPPGLDWTTTPSLGMQLINVLARHQLGGQVEVDTQAGTAFKITFAERKKR
jgi:PAS domain S-box-containing protein